MFPKLLLTALLAICSIVSGLPTAGTVDSVQLFKRDAVLTERDLELASLHGVDVTRSFKHSVIKRDNGDDITIWVHRSFVEDREASPSRTLAERQAHPVKPSELSGNFYLHNYPVPPYYMQCSGYTHVDKTNSTSPFADSAAYLATWANNTLGSFSVIGGILPQGGFHYAWTDLVVAGTNSGGNAFFAVGVGRQGRSAKVSTDSVFSLVDHSHTHFKRKYGSTWRVAEEGTTRCWQVLWWHENVLGTADWRLTGTQALV